jgi:hypothetical protein
MEFGSWRLDLLCRGLVAHLGRDNMRMQKFAFE